jgi:hypothetical protein
VDGHLTGVGWRQERLHFEMRDAPEGKALVAISAGDEVALEVVGKRSCIGFRAPDSESLTPCPKSVEGIGASQCPDCFDSSKMLPCLRCNGERCTNPARRGECVQPYNHAVYLAAFAPGVFKVGVARWSRRFERLAEQGARLALIVARDDGQQVRRMESQFAFASVPDRLAPTEKLRAYTMAAPLPALEEQLRELYMATRLRVIGQWLREPHVVELPEMPVLEATPQLLRPHPGLRIRGRVFAVCGQILIMDTDVGERVALEATQLIGHRLRSLEGEEQGTGQMAMGLL